MNRDDGHDDQGPSHHQGEKKDATVELKIAETSEAPISHTKVQTQTLEPNQSKEQLVLLVTKGPLNQPPAQTNPKTREKQSVSQESKCHEVGL